MSTSPSHNGKVIITCAITGSIHTPSMSPYLPVTPNDIVDSAFEAAEAGAAILHLHARDPETGRPDQRPGVRAVPRTHQAGHQRRREPHERRQPLHDDRRAHQTLHPLQAGARLLEHGIDELRPVSDLNRFKDFKHEWERQYLESTRDLVFRNTFKDIEFALTALSANGTRFEFECYDVGHLYNLPHFAERKLIEPPFLVQSVFGILGGIGTHAEDVMHMRRTADRLFGADYRWSVLGAGRMQMPIAAMAAAMGAHVRVGLEDSLCIGKGQLARSNAEQVRRVRSIVEGFGLAPATPDEARDILHLKGADTVSF